MRVLILALSAAACLLPVADTAQAFSSFYAVVNSGGSVARGSGVDSGTRVSTGRYNVTFTRSVKNCAHVASLATTTAGSAVVTAHPSPTNKILQIFTFGPTGTASNQNFTVMVSCAP
jgi:hypothetical protein